MCLVIFNFEVTCRTRNIKPSSDATCGCSFWFLECLNTLDALELEGFCVLDLFSPNSLLLRFYLRKKELATRPLNSVAGLCVQALSPLVLCVQALSSSCPLWLGSVLGLILFLFFFCPCGRAPEPCVRVLSSSCPCLGRAPELCGWLTGEECGRTNSDVNSDQNALMKQFALGVKVGRTKKSMFD